VPGAGGSLTDGQREFVAFVARHAGAHPDAVAALAGEVWAYLAAALCVDELLDNGRLQELFNGRVADVNAERAGLICECVRFAVLLTLSASVGLAPGLEEEAEFAQFLADESETPVIAFDSDELYDAVAKAEGSVISLNTFTTYPEIIRFSRSEIKWAVLEMESECVRGFWANETRNILFDAVTSNERAGIQFNSHLLRNITNQSCNPPIGYPVVVSNVIRSLSES
jgi:hypothetical protein